jgi:hypothetical protein
MGLNLDKDVGPKLLGNFAEHLRSAALEFADLFIGEPLASERRADDRDLALAGDPVGHDVFDHFVIEGFGVGLIVLAWLEIDVGLIAVLGGGVARFHDAGDGFVGADGHQIALEGAVYKKGNLGGADLTVLIDEGGLLRGSLIDQRFIDEGGTIGVGRLRGRRQWPDDIALTQLTVRLLVR